MGAKPWTKVWETFWTTRSHLELTGPDLGIGVRMLSLANASPHSDAHSDAHSDVTVSEDVTSDTDLRWLLLPSGAPMSIAVIARESRFSLAEVELAAQRLTEAGTLVRRGDGAIGFLNFERWQESPSAGRMRKKRHSDAHSDAHSDVTVTARGQRSEVRGERSEEEISVEPSSTAGGSGATDAGAAERDPGPPLDAPDPAETPKRKPAPAPPDALAVIEHYRAAGHPAALKQPTAASREVKLIMARIKHDGFSVADLCLAIDGIHRLPFNRGDNPAGRKYLGLDLIARDASHVTQYMEAATGPAPKPNGAEPKPPGLRYIP